MTHSLNYLLLLLITSVVYANLEVRTWTNKAGSSMEASLVKLDTDYAYLKKKTNSAVIRAPLSQISEKDILFLKSSPFWHSKGYLYTEKAGAIIVLDLQGDVRCHDLSMDSPVGLTIGSKITAQHKINTEKGSVTLLFSNGSSTTINNNSEFIIEEYLQEKIQKEEVRKDQENEFSASRSRLKLNYGSIFSSIKKLENRSAFTITTPVGAAGIRGTEIFLSADKDKVEFSVVDGLADFWMPSEGIISVGNDKNLQFSGSTVEVTAISESRKKEIIQERSNISKLKEKVSFEEMIQAMDEIEEKNEMDLFQAESRNQEINIKTSRDLASWLIGTSWEIDGGQLRTMFPPKNTDDEMTKKRMSRSGKIKPTLQFFDNEFAKWSFKEKQKYEIKSKNKVYLSHLGKKDKGRGKWIKSWELRFSDDYQSVEMINLNKQETIIGTLVSK